MMKCVLCTGITGRERRRCLKKLQDYVNKPSNLVIMDPWEKTKQLHPHISEATILQATDQDRMNYFTDAYKDIANAIKNLRGASKDTVVAVPMHAIFYWRSYN